MLGVFNIIKEIIVMGEKITKEQPSEKAKDSMGNPVGYSHKRPHVPDGKGEPFPSFKDDKNRLKDNITERRKKENKDE
jgi:hypothetical protein